MFVIKHTAKGWVIEYCLPIPDSRYYRVAGLYWRSAPELLHPSYVFPNYEAAKKECDARSRITR